MVEWIRWISQSTGILPVEWQWNQRVDPLRGLGGVAFNPDWLSSPDAKNDSLVTDPVQYWWARRKDYPRLSRMALDLLSVPPMSAECERLFSVAGQMVSPQRTRLEASTIGITQTLRSWVRNGLIDAVDTLIDVSGEVGNSIIWEVEEDS